MIPLRVGGRECRPRLRALRDDPVPRALFGQTPTPDYGHDKIFCPEKYLFTCANLYGLLQLVDFQNANCRVVCMPYVRVPYASGPHEPPGPLISTSAQEFSSIYNNIYI